MTYKYRDQWLKPKTWRETYFSSIGAVWKSDDPTLTKYEIHAQPPSPYTKGIVTGEVNINDYFIDTVEWTIKGLKTTSYYKVDPPWGAPALNMWNIAKLKIASNLIVDVNVNGGWTYKEFQYILPLPYTTTEKTVTVEREVGMTCPPGTYFPATYAGCGSIDALILADIVVEKPETATLTVTCIDIATGLAVEGVKVEIIGPVTRIGETDGSGAATFPNIIVGSYTIKVYDPQKRYYGQTREAVAVKPPTTTEAFSLTPIPSPYAPILEAIARYWWVATIPVGIYAAYRLWPKAKPAWERAMEKLAKYELLKKIGEK